MGTTMGVIFDYIAFPAKMKLEAVIDEYKAKVPAGFTIRQLQKSDFHNGYLKLLEQLTTVGNVTENQFIETVDQMEAQKKVCIVMVDDSKQIKAIGSVIIECKLIHDCQSVGHIEDIVVDDSCRGMGLGKIIIEQLVEICRAMNCYKTVLTCAEKNVGFYEKCGFERKSINMAIYFDH
jgi:ribosomal protein S18 acetylase RimI-like enzyme